MMIRKVVNVTKQKRILLMQNVKTLALLSLIFLPRRIKHLRMRAI